MYIDFCHDFVVLLWSALEMCLCTYYSALSIKIIIIIIIIIVISVIIIIIIIISQINYTTASNL